MTKPTKRCWRVVCLTLACLAIVPRIVSAQVVATTATSNNPNPGGTLYTYVVVAKTKQNITIVSQSSSTRSDPLSDGNFNNVSWLWAAGRGLGDADITAFDVYRIAGGSTQGKLATLDRANRQLRDTGLGADGTKPPVASVLPPRITAVPAGGSATASYVIVTRNASGTMTAGPTGTTSESAASFDQSHFNDIAWDAIATAQSYDLFRVIGGGTQGRIATVVATGAPIYQLRDGGLAGDGSVPPDAGAKDAAISAPSLAVPLSEGMKVVSGTKGAGAKPNSIEVLVRVARAIKPNSTDYVQRQVTSTLNDDGSFAVGLPFPLLAGQSVIVCARGASGVALPSGCHDPVLVDTPDDWGRVRAYFAAGVVLSQGENSFSQQDLAVSFTLDKTWWMRQKTGAFAPQAFNTFFDTRITAIPVGTGTTTTSTPAPGSPAAGTTSTQQFINSQKAAMMQAGFYLPLFHASWEWTHNSQENAVFLAPIAKFGIVTTARTGTTTTTPSTASPSGSTTTTTTATTNDSGVYKFYAFGFGVGHERLSGSTDSAAEMISYLHTTFGKWENFSVSDWRLGFEGRLKIPSAPFQIGFDANLPLHTGQADLRFVVGTRFDIGDLLAKLKQF